MPARGGVPDGSRFEVLKRFAAPARTKMRPETRLRAWHPFLRHEIWEFRNEGRGSMMGMVMAHSMHIHGVQFRVLKRVVNGRFADAYRTISAGLVDEGWKDTVLVMPGGALSETRPSQTAVLKRPASRYGKDSVAAAEVTQRRNLSAGWSRRRYLRALHPRQYPVPFGPELSWPAR